jgi:transposase
VKSRKKKIPTVELATSPQVMTLHPKNHWEVPKETARVARASFAKGNVYIKMYDELGTIYEDSDFKELFPARCGKSAI